MKALALAMALAAALSDEALNTATVKIDDV
jgi:hypothetical protein